MSDILHDMLLDKANWFLLIACVGWVMGLGVSLFWKLRDGGSFYRLPPWWSFVALAVFFFYAALRDDSGRKFLETYISPYYYLSGIALVVGLFIGWMTRFLPFGRVRVGSSSNDVSSDEAGTVHGPKTGQQRTASTQVEPSESLKRLLLFQKRMEDRSTVAENDGEVNTTQDGEVGEERPKLSRRFWCLASPWFAVASPTLLLIARGLHRWISSIPEKSLITVFVFAAIGIIGLLGIVSGAAAVGGAWHCAFGKDPDET